MGGGGGVVRPGGVPLSLGNGGWLSFSAVGQSDVGQGLKAGGVRGCTRAEGGHQWKTR